MPKIRVHEEVRQLPLPWLTSVGINRPDNLAPDIQDMQEEILFLPKTSKGRDPIKEADINPIAETLDWIKQRQMWQKLRQAVTNACPAHPIERSCT